MRRLLRWTFNTLAAVSLLLCLATAGLWVRSYWAFDQLVGGRQEASEFGRRDDGAKRFECCIASDRGYFTGWFRSTRWSEQPEGQPTPPWTFKLVHPRNHFGWTWRIWFRAYFRATREVSFRYGDSRWWSWGVPDWMLVSAFAVLPAIAAFRQTRAVRRRRRRSRLGLCPACGYDLRASPERCPECGRADDKVTR